MCETKDPFTLDNKQMASSGGDREGVYSIIVDTSIKLRTSMEEEPPYAKYNFIMTSNSTADKKTSAGYWSQKRCFVLLIAVLLVVILVSASVGVTIFVVQKLKSTGQSTPPPSTTPKALTTRTTAVSTTLETTVSTLPNVSPPTTVSTTLPTTVSTTPPTTVSTTTPLTTVSTTPSTTTPTTPPTTVSTPPPTGNCSTSKVCHACTSREVNGRCRANGALVDTVEFGMTIRCTMACFAEVRGPDSNYVYRGCVSSEGDRVMKASQGTELCFQMEKWPGAGLSTYCFCCGELCNVQDMTTHGGRD
ncbi:location of vulva defective 1-like isoform X1 [Gigantopelta aegis]|uniref:location of vulva defective 1-like isoform X1 n=1 Tax=Gigantopelta aegis TaxID=1735272 RepID=UPI001B88B64C|nr:location of vulva defective 1-like isoform X1 [Gigantopelta aegis]XP_041376357.1 location of vulva defective 1-like isoform X1 [Gigantopelta aegis]XP_041376358.1 location of vulva defective 1-like isoform X1 [Gigantopelta aegis]